MGEEAKQVRLLHACFCNLGALFYFMVLWPTLIHCLIFDWQEQAKAEAKPEEKAEEKKDEKPAEEKKEEPKPPSPFVLFVDLHCVGCAKKIEKTIMRITGLYLCLSLNIYREKSWKKYIT